MSEKPSPASDTRDAEKTARREAARVKVLNGTIGAISLDTCIFTDAGYRLDGGIFKPLEQFKGNAFSLIFSEVTISEVHQHMSRKADEDKAALTSKMRSFGKSWLFPPAEQERTLEALIGGRTGREVAAQRIKDFAARCGFDIVRAKSTLDINALLKSYFGTRAPFEGAADKKSEFPDAITLLSLQGWAQQNKKSVLFVTKDKGCQAFCSGTDTLLAIDELDDALALIQERQDYLTQDLCKKAEQRFSDAGTDEILEEIRGEIEGQIWDLDWIPTAETAYTYESEMQEVEVLSADLVWSGASPKLRAVEFTAEVLVVQASMNIEVDASCSFSFSIKDGIDHDMVNIGDATVSTKARVAVEVLLSFDINGGEVLDLSAVELLSSRCEIDFGSVQPDYGNEDLNVEDY